MSNEFWIQSSAPKVDASNEPLGESLSDATQQVFPFSTERMVMVWKGVYIPLSYKYDVSFMIDDVIDLAIVMLDGSEGCMSVAWPSNTFASVWNVTWSGGLVRVEASWHCVVGHTEGLLRDSGAIALPIDDFLGEWRRPLEIILDALSVAGYVETQIPRIGALKDVLKRLPAKSQLY